MRDLVTKKQEIKAPSRPVIVQVVSSLPAGTEVACSEYADEAGEVIPAGTPVFYDPFESMWYAGTTTDKYVKGILINDCVVYEDSESRYTAGAIMLAGVINVDYFEDDDLKRKLVNHVFGSPIIPIGHWTPMDA